MSIIIQKSWLEAHNLNLNIRYKYKKNLPDSQSPET